MAGEHNKGDQVLPDSIQSPLHRRMIVGLFVVALLIRFGMIWLAGTATPPEIRFVSLASGLVSGAGYQGLDMRIPNAVLPPGFPLLVALITWVLGDPLLSGRLLAAVAGACITLPIVGITRRVFSDAAAARAGGALMGWAVISWPEAVYFLAFGTLHLTVMLWLRNAGDTRTALMRILLPLGAAALIISPYALWIHSNTGHWLLTPAAALNTVHEHIQARGVKMGWKERPGTSLMEERVRYGLAPERSGLAVHDAYRAAGYLPEEGGQSTAGIPSGGWTRLSMGTFKNGLRRFYLDTIKYGLVLPIFLMGLLALGILSRPWSEVRAERGQIMLAVWLSAGFLWGGARACSDQPGARRGVFR